MAKARKDKQGRALRKGEYQRKEDGRYVYSFTDPFGKRTFIYGVTLAELRAKEDKLVKDQLDGIDTYVAGKATLNFLFDRYISTKRELRSSTRTNYLYIYDHFVRNSIGKQVVSSIRYSDILRFYQDLRHCNCGLNKWWQMALLIWLNMKHEEIKNNDCKRLP